MATEAQKFADQYGYQLAFLKSDKELYGIFLKAMSGDWDQTRFVAAVKNSTWYKTHGEAFRTNLALKTSDPATWKQNLASKFAEVAALSASMGGTYSGSAISKIASDALMFGYNDAQIRKLLAATVRLNDLGNATGQAGDVVQQLRETAYRNGINVSDGWLIGQAQQIASGRTTLEDGQRILRDKYAKALAPGFAKELEAGMDLYDLASPYMQTMSKTLELNPSDVDLFDPTIRSALASSNDKDGQVGSTPLWQFELNLKQDPRFMKTKQAQDQTMSVGRQVLQDMGLASR